MLRQFGRESTTEEKHAPSTFPCFAVLTRWCLFIGYCSVVLLVFTNNTTIMNSSGVFFRLPNIVQGKDNNMMPSSTTTKAADDSQEEALLPNNNNLRRASDCANSLPPPNFLTSSSLLLNEAWDQCEVYATSSFTCQWTHYRNRASVCMNPNDPSMAYMRHTIQASGQWPECEKLTAGYEEIVKNVGAQQPLLVVELGSLGGICTLDMLLMTDANVVVFENNEEKLHALTSMILGLPKEYRQRVVVVPSIALPTEPMLYATTYNKQKKKTNFFFSSKTAAPEQEDKVMTPLSAMNSMFKNTNIALLKIDTPGVSCNILEQWNRCTVVYEPPSLGQNNTTAGIAVDTKL
mmetsp:Transcript_22822/g.34592  ORF Transcript_22822/g.34592 Transcript_22822/m.34592 type:complete len:348 (-) Transcript_22822:39-1082(-)